MIKAMISHAGEDDLFVDYLYERLERANLGLDIFVDHKRNLAGDDAQRMIDEARGSIVFIPVLSDFSVTKEFFNNEIKTAIGSRSTYIFPLKFNCDDNKVPHDINIAFSTHDRVTGKLYLDFSKRAEWSLKTEELLKAIVAKLTEINLYRKDEFFYQDVEHIDRILSRENPSPGEIKTMVDVFLMKEAYQYYFFKRLKRLSWLTFLRLYGFFNRNPWPVEVENQPGSYTMPRWSVLDYLEWCSTQITKSENSAFGEALIDIVRSVSNYRDQNGKRNDNYITDWVFIKIIANLPDRFITAEDIALVATYLESRWKSTLVGPEIASNLLPAMLNRGQREKSIKLFDIATTVKWVNESGDSSPDSIIDAYWLSDLFERNIESLASVCPLEASEILLGRITEMTKHKPSEFNIFEVTAIENHSQDDLHKGRLPNIIVRGARDLLNALVTKDKESAINILTGLLKREHPIFRRLAISVASANWQSCSALYGIFANRHMLNDHNIKHEIYVFLKQNFNNLKQEEKDKIIDLIELGSDRADEESTDEKRQAYWKQGWLSAIIPSGYPRSAKLYKKHKAVTNIEPDHPDFSTWTEMGWGPDPSPISVDILLQKNNSDVANYLSSYKETLKTWRGPSREGLQEALFKAVRTNPEKFYVDLHPFVQIPIDYQYRIIGGFRKAWEEKTDLDWEKIVSFCTKIVMTKEFWVSPEKNGDGNRRGIIISEIADLVTDGTKDDSRAFPSNLLPQAEELLLVLLTRTESKLERPDDLLFEVLNSAKGRVLTALVNYSLRVARLGGLTANPKWAGRVKDEFARRLDRTVEPDLRFLLTLGRYLPNLYYLDKQWVESNINQIFPKDIEDHWQAAMEGYLLHGKVYSVIYDLLRSNDHYQKAIETTFRDKEARKRLIEHLCIGYLLEKEEVGDQTSPFQTCLDSWDIETLTQIIWFFWIQREYLVDKEAREIQTNQQDIIKKQTDRILKFWRYIYGILKSKGTLTENEKKFASDLSRLSCYVKALDPETLEMIVFSAKYVDKNFNSSFFIEYLLRLCDVSPSQVGEIFIVMLDSSTPVFDQKIIRAIVTILYQSGQVDVANKISNIYGGRGIEFLRDIYELYNS
ncbi:MAG: toll/interleukin-1 receptor domain-containing protein [Dehalococcoidales bacterium]|nr:toll/interleukin-1 receptor domain-containing protein [Dehalococcoidales bacterium]